MWVISVNYPVFLTLIFHDCFSSTKRYLFRDVATNGAPLYCCVRWYLNMEGQPTVCRTSCRLLRLFSATDCEASQYKGLISFVLPEWNACRIRIRVITTNSILFRMQGLAFHFKIFAKGIVSGIEMRGLAIMEQETIKWTDPPTTQHVHSL